jgi:hypothetical protein
VGADEVEEGVWGGCGGVSAGEVVGGWGPGGEGGRDGGVRGVSVWVWEVWVPREAGGDVGVE